jgi:hypothetical protein
LSTTAPLGVRWNDGLVNSAALELLDERVVVATIASKVWALRKKPLFAVPIHIVCGGLMLVEYDLANAAQRSRCVDIGNDTACAPNINPVAR